jgi:hypothetical protein
VARDELVIRPGLRREADKRRISRSSVPVLDHRSATQLVYPEDFMR